MLSLNQVKDVCCMNGGSNECRYLDSEFDKGKTIHLCKKLSTDRTGIDQEIIKFFNKMKKNGQDPYTQGLALGDNCQGYLPFKSKKQGYDVP